MRKLSDYRDEEALDLLADLIDPVSELTKDEKFMEAIRKSEKDDKRPNYMAAVKIALKSHKQAVMQLLATLEGVPVEEYHCTFLTLPMKLLEVLSDTEMFTVFTSQVQEMKRAMSSGPAMENTGENEN